MAGVNWHRRFQQQAQWSQALRAYLFGQFSLSQRDALLEVGCGTGAILNTLPESRIFGLDIDPNHLQLARQHAPAAQLTAGDGLMLPFRDRSFRVTLCHFFLLWIAPPLQALLEMKRVTRPGGRVLALAEPDYGGRVDYPEALAPLGTWQTEALRQQGADPSIGRKLSRLFHQTGLTQIETGVLGGQWGCEPNWDAWDSEWAVMAADLKQNSKFANNFEQFKNADRAAYQNGSRVLYVPTFYASGIVP